METILVHPENQAQLKAVKAILKALKIGYETTAESPYNKKFVEKIQKSRSEYKSGKSRRVSLDDIWK